MPIRSPRGRSAAYRVIWQWPLRSPGRLAFVVVVVLAVAVGVTVGLGLLRGPEPAAAPFGPTTARPSAGATTPSSGTPRSTPGGTSAASPLPLSEAPTEALDAAERWAKAWVRPAEDTTARQWLDRLRPLTTEEYIGVLSGVDPENVPATRVTGEPEAVRVADRNVQVEVETDAVTLRILVVDTEAGWRVAGYDRV
ncbi:hypothetical protein [Pseudonocardia lacus]|uniref:hypothetical protein n=1 Tax=Pseudonocardia lacus TaxID=2835865 RepID=UPI001BDD3BB6|nr:hypothetical protein [Pseudonocardia lacus]